MTRFDLTDVDRDIPGTRYFSLDNGNRAVFSREGNPFGYWTVRFEKGGQPKDLDGMFTSYEQAITAFQTYLAKKNAKRYNEVNMEDEPKIKSKTRKSNKQDELFN